MPIGAQNLASLCFKASLDYVMKGVIEIKLIDKVFGFVKVFL